MIQYHKSPEATAQTIDKEGWMKTGSFWGLRLENEPRH